MSIPKFATKDEARAFAKSHGLQGSGLRILDGGSNAKTGQHYGYILGAKNSEQGLVALLQYDALTVRDANSGRRVRFQSQERRALDGGEVVESDDMELE